MRDAAAVAHASTAAQFASLLGDRRFLALFIAHLGSNLGDWLAFLALWAAIGIDGSGGAPALAALAVAYLLPLIVVMPWAAACVDRWPLRRLLVGADLARAALVAGFIWVDDLAGRCALLFALQGIGCFFNPAQLTAVARLVPRQRLVAANALTTQAAHAAKLLGPAVAGLVVGAWGAHAAFWIDAGSFAASAALLATLPALPAVAAAAGDAPAPGAEDAALAATHADAHADVVRPALRRAWRDVAAGARFAWHERGVRDAITSALIASIGLGAWLATFAVLARDRWGAGARGTGLLVSGAGIGAILGALLVVPLARRFGAAAVARASVALVAAALLASAIAVTRPWAIVATLTLGAATAAVFAPATAVIQAATPAARLGRVQGAAIAAAGLAQAVSVALCGIATRAFAAPRIVAVAAMFVAAAAIAIQLVARRAPRAKRDTCASPSTKKRSNRNASAPA